MVSWIVLTWPGEVQTGDEIPPLKLKKIAGGFMKRKISFLLLSLVATTAVVVSPQTRRRQIQPTPDRSPSAAQQPSDAGQSTLDVVRIDTTLVTVPVSVRDRDGRFIPDLQKQDFKIYEEGIEQEIAYFAPTETPFTVILMIDTSASTWSKLGHIKAAAKVFVEQLRPDDQVGVISFGMGIKVQSKPSSDRKKINSGIEGTSRGLSTHLYDAMEKLMQKYLTPIKGRKAVVLFTDGVDATSNHATYESTIHTAEELDALIYSIRYDTYDVTADKGDIADPLPRLRLPGILGKLPLPSIGPSSGGGAGSSRADYDRGQRYLQELAELTGGRVYEASRDLSDLQTAFSNIADELGRQYSIGYYPQRKGQTGESRHIKVRVSRPEAAVRSRDNYVYKGPADVIPKAGRAEPEKQIPSPPVLQKKPFVSDLKVPW
jgi:VWFA-related protein